jgi:hypothetical protein
VRTSAPRSTGIRKKETSVGLISMYVVAALGRVVADQNADLGDWLCKTLGICA